MAEAYRLHLMQGLERLLSVDGFSLVAGVDEAGRGCLAGPVVAAAVIPDPKRSVPGVNDSKKLTPKLREELEPAIKRSSLAWAVSEVSADEIDRGNILLATKTAMLQCLEKLRPRPQCALIDAVALELDYPCLPVIRGDAVSYAIASASILAKVGRDRLMRQLDRRYPVYGFAANKGYGALEHRQALATYGPSPIHRLTFKSVLPRSETASLTASTAA